MNSGLTDASAPAPDGFASLPDGRREGWSRQRWVTSVMFVFAAQLAIIFVLGRRHFPPQRPLTNVPQMTLADSSSELIALDNPTLFVLPHADDFGSAVWSKTPAVTQKPFPWPEQSGALLSPAVENLGVVFARFMRTNRFGTPVLDFKPEPQLSEPLLTLPPMFSPDSTLQIIGELAGRKWLNPVNLPSWPYSDVIAPSRVQVVVDQEGAVISAALLSPDNSMILLPSVNFDVVRYDPADQRALQIARRMRFAPARSVASGQLIFYWRTVPPPATNSPAALP
ncbi:MAG TPA: hypothetical protein VFY06_06295 [Verrucomicrobiae bacterium]|nr:hypothetical protein [Verrucomicrobiae bacterium]